MEQLAYEVMAPKMQPKQSWLCRRSVSLFDQDRFYRRGFVRCARMWGLRIREFGSLTEMESRGRKGCDLVLLGFSPKDPAFSEVVTYFSDFARPVPIVHLYEDLDAPEISSLHGVARMMSKSLDVDYILERCLELWELQRLTLLSSGI